MAPDVNTVRILLVVYEYYIGSSEWMGVGESIGIHPVRRKISFVPPTYVLREGLIEKLLDFFFFTFFFSTVPFVIFALRFSLPPSRNTDPGSRTIAGSSPPYPLRFAPCVFFQSREDLDVYTV